MARRIRVGRFDEAQLLIQIGDILEEAREKPASTRVIDLNISSRHPDLWAELYRERPNAEQRTKLYHRLDQKVGPDRMERLSRARTILLREHRELGERLDVGQINSLARRLKNEGPDPYRNTEDGLVANVLVEVGLLPFSVIDPKRESDIERRAQGSMSHRW
jgi:hypothetical protein